MTLTFNKLLGSILDVISDALPVILLVAFYQITVLQLPVEEVMGMFGWLLAIATGLVLIL
jgi:hypothetical protein